MIRPTTTEAENDRDRPTGAGAAPGRQDRQPRAATRRGGRDGRSIKFYAHLAQMPAISARAAVEIRLPYVTATQIIARGEFIGSARWLTSAPEPEGPERNFEPKRPPMAGEIDAQAEHPAEGDTDLDALLAAITNDVQSRASAARAGIRADFAGRINHVRKHVSGFARAAAISALVEARKAALALINQSAAMELTGRKRAAILTHGSKLRKPNRAGGPRNDTSTPGNVPQ